MRFENNDPNSPVNLLGKAADNYIKHLDEYGESWVVAGEILAKIMPDDFNPTTPDQWTKMSLYVHILNKVIRLGQSGLEHEDSAFDLQTYAAMIQAMIRTEIPF